MSKLAYFVTTYGSAALAVAGVYLGLARAAAASDLAMDPPAIPDPEATARLRERQRISAAYCEEHNLVPANWHGRAESEILRARRVRMEARAAAAREDAEGASERRHREAVERTRRVVRGMEVA